MQTGRSVTAGEIADGLRALGVRPGDVIHAHSSLSAFGHVDGGAEAVVDALLQAVGADGTASVPTHTWHLVSPENPVFDVRTTPCCVGAVPEAFRRRPEARRSLHPTHSCAAIGARRDELLAGHHTDVTPCGGRSPYQRLIEWGGRIVFLGVTLQCNTAFHALEELACAGWLFDRCQELLAVDYEGSRIPVPSRRHANPYDRAFGEQEPLLEAEGVLRRGRIGEADVRIVDAAGMREVLLPRLARDVCCLLTPGARRLAERLLRR